MSGSLNYFKGNSSGNKSNLLLWKRCIYMSQTQYKSNRHIDPNMLCIKGITTNVDNYVTTQIRNIASKLLNNKVPGPVYVMYAKKLEFDETIFENCLTESKSYEGLVKEEESLKLQRDSSKTQLSSYETQLRAEKSKQNYYRDPIKINNLEDSITQINQNKGKIESRLKEIDKLVLEHLSGVMDESDDNNEDSKTNS